MLQFSYSHFSPRRSRTGGRQVFQRFLAFGLAALLFLAPFSFSTSAKQSTVSGTKQSWSKQFTIYQDENGNAVCRVATLTERIQRENIDTSKLGMRRINHLKGDRTDNLQ